MENAMITSDIPDLGSDVYVRSKPLNIQRRIGSTVYDVELFVKKDKADTIEEKVLRILKNDLNLAIQNGNIKLPQTGRLPERIIS
ncbi:MAG: transposon-encoded TnpW family protein [Oscillospiraceae bacterium]|nr:transposon-encoded TnpW family protein [Oscillospiraceae bacterium]